MRRRLLTLLVLIVAIGAAAWHWQSVIIGTTARWYLARMAQREQASGELAGRRDAVARVNRTLLMPAPADALVPELFDLMTALSSRVATGEVSLEWAAYIYTSYQRDLVQERPGGTPRRTPEEVATALAHYVEFYSKHFDPAASAEQVADMKSLLAKARLKLNAHGVHGFTKDHAANRRLLVVEHGHYTSGYGSHVIAEVAQALPGVKTKKLAFPDVPGPGAAGMMRWLRPDAPKIVDAAMQMMRA